jgi:hypothetical protein
MLRHVALVTVKTTLDDPFPQAPDYGERPSVVKRIRAQGLSATVNPRANGATTGA